MIVLTRANNKELLEKVLAYLKSRYPEENTQDLKVLQEGKICWCLFFDGPRERLLPVISVAAELAKGAMEWISEP